MFAFRRALFVWLLVSCLTRLIQGVPAVDADVDVIIVGAGPAGVAAATKLDKHGINVKVFEGQAYIGGRIRSVKFGDAVIDLGAEWCHGEGGNIVYDIMKNSQVLQHGNYTFDIADSNGNMVANDFKLELLDIFDSLYSADGARNTSEGETLGAYFTKAYFDVIKEKYVDKPEKYAFARLVYHSFNKYILSSEGSFSWFEPSAISDYKDCEGDLALTWNGLGFKTILDTLMQSFDKQKIHLSTEVKKIALDDTRGNVVVTLFNEEKHIAKYVIFTPSVGVLKHDHSKLFQPSLPQEKINSIKAIGIGAVMKVLLKFSQRWWDQDSTFSGITFVWTQDDWDTLPIQFRKGPIHTGLSWLTNFMGIYRLENNPNVLSCWFTGEFVPEIEAMVEETLIQGIMFTLNKFLGKNYTIQNPKGVIRSQWYMNKFTRGTYSFQTITSRKLKPSANEILSRPILNRASVPKILFAGETTHPYHYSTVHGAIETGFREADRLIEIMNKK